MAGPSDQNPAGGGIPRGAGLQGGPIPSSLTTGGVLIKDW
jgi:hypothetical protein